MSKEDRRMTYKQSKEEKKEARVQRRAEKLQRKSEKLANAGKFRQRRHRRAFWGATLTVLAGLLELYIPIQLYAIAFISRSLAFVSLLFCELLLIIGIIGYIFA